MDFTTKEGQIDSNSFLGAEIIKHNFGPNLLKECPLFEVDSALSSRGGNNCLLSTAGEATEVKPVEGLHLTGVPLDRQPPPCSQERERESERGDGGWGAAGGRGGGGRLKEFICQLKL